MEPIRNIPARQALTQAVALARQDVLSAVAALHEDLKHLDLRPKAVALASGVAPDAAISGEPVNRGLLDATDDAINAGCLSLQTLLGVTDGGIAGVCFSGDAQRAPVAQALAAYLLTEVNSAQE